MTTRQVVTIGVLLGAALALPLAIGSDDPLQDLRDAKARADELLKSEELQVTPLPDVRKIEPAAIIGLRVSAEKDGYRVTLPALTYRRGPGPNIDFLSKRLHVRYLGSAGIQMNLKDVPDAPDYFKETDPFQIVVDAFRTRPMDVRDAASAAEVRRHYMLLMLKATLMPTGADTHWEEFQRDELRGHIAGDTSLEGISVEIYVPQTQELVMLLLGPQKGASMKDVHCAIAELQIEPLEQQQPTTSQPTKEGS